MKKFMHPILGLAAALAVIGGPALAAEQKPSDDKSKEAPAFVEPSTSPGGPDSHAGTPAKPSNGPSASANPVLADFIKAGVKVYFLGLRDGLNGWFLIRDNQIQIAYSPLDNKNIIFGALYDGLGSSITMDQIRALYDSNEEVKTLLNKYNTAQNTVVGAPVGGNLPQIGGPQMATLGSGASLDQTGAPNLTPPPPTISPPPPLVPPTTTAATPGERLMHALQAADGVDVGAATAPRIYMVADPNCPHCQITWRMIREAVMAGKIEIRIVPISIITDPEDERAAAQFLRVPNALDAWDKYIVNGDKGQLAGKPDDAALIAVRNNHALIDSWHIQQTPFIIYRSKQGQVKIEQGEPHDAAALINDIGL